MDTYEAMWDKLASNKAYRDEFSLTMFKRMVPFQAKAMRKKRGWSQEDLARNSRVTQGVISRVEDPDYGNLTINTICRVAAGFDVAFIGKFVPFTDLMDWYEASEEETGTVPFFQEQNETAYRPVKTFRRTRKNRPTRPKRALLVEEPQSENKVIPFPAKNSTPSEGKQQLKLSFMSSATQNRESKPREISRGWRGYQPNAGYVPRRAVYNGQR